MAPNPMNFIGFGDIRGLLYHGGGPMASPDLGSQAFGRFACLPAPSSARLAGLGLASVIWLWFGWIWLAFLRILAGFDLISAGFGLAWAGFAVREQAGMFKFHTPISR